MQINRLLLVEDDAAHSELIFRAFRQHGSTIEILIATNLSQARVLLDAGGVDFAIIDWRLPDGRGIELLESHAQITGIPAVILTSHGDERAAVDALKAGALNYVVKSETTFADMPQIVDSAMREWGHIQERNAAHIALAQSEERFRNLIEGSLQGIIISRGWKPVFVNQAYADILGYDNPQEILALESDLQMYPDYERERIATYYRDRLDGNGRAPTHYEYDAICKDGRIVSLQNVARLVSWDNEPAIQGVVLDISDRKRAEEALQYRVQLEQLITGISARFINLTSSEMDAGITDALQEIAQFSEVDRSYVVLFDDENKVLTSRYEWCAPGVESLLGQLQDAPASTLGWMMERHSNGEIVYAPSIEYLPEEASAEKQRFRQLGIKSLITLPLISRGEVLGFLGFDAVFEEKSFSEDVISILTIVGESFANAIARKKFEDSLLESEQRFKDFADVAADWFWEMDANLRFSFISERYQEVVGVAPSAHVGKTCEELFASQIEDTEVWHEFLEALVNRREVNVELNWIRLDRSERVVCQVGRPRFDSQGLFVGYRGVGRDITEAHRMTAQIAHQASHDALTGLVNRREFESRLERAVKNAQDNGVQYVLGYIDLDRFKIVNDVAGHGAGDVLLKQVAGILNRKIRGRDTFARLGGDEFCLLLENCPLEKALQIANGMLQDIGAFRFVWEGRNFDVGLSIGLISVNVHSESASRMLAQADMACYTAKRLGTNRVHVYQMENSELARRQSDIRRVSDLRDALDNDQLRLFAQPIVPLDNEPREPIHYELLLRVLTPDGVLTTPERFIPAAERYGLMVPIDRWVIKTALQYVGVAGADAPRLAINLSGNSLNDDTTLEFVQDAFRKAGVAPKRICFEITETAAIQNFDKANHFIQRLRVQGCRFALDDFGSGVSSFNYLKHLPVDYLKIDGGFVQHMATESVDRAMVAAIHEVGRIMGIQTIAERADTRAVVEQLRALGIDYAQGDTIGEAVALERVAGYEQIEQRIEVSL